jgi:glycosyltransferase involved in cell wall biosynthesis
VAAGPGAPDASDRRVAVGIGLLSQMPEQFTGTGVYVSELIRELAGRPSAVSLEVLCNEQMIERVTPLVTPSVRVSRAEGYRVGGSRLARAAAIASALARPGPLGRQLSAGVELVHYPLTIPVPRVYLPTVVTLHDALHHDHPELFSRAQRLWRRFTFDKSARRATMVVTDSEHARGRIVESVGVDSERIVAIHLGVDRERFRPGPVEGDDERVAALGLPERFVFYPASLWPFKNHQHLVAAFAQVDDPDLRLVFSGATMGRLDDVMGTARQYGVSERVQHLGFIDHEAVPAVYRRATAVAFPSWYEGFGAPPLEAMACGCPVASSREASLAEVCGEAALELDPRDISQMAEALGRVVGDERLRAQLREAGFAQAARFSWADAAEAHLGVYRRALELAG